MSQNGRKSGKLQTKNHDFQVLGGGGTEYCLHFTTFLSILSIRGRGEGGSKKRRQCLQFLE